jgi:hypothetical protein
MLSLTITDTRDQTAAVFRALAQETNRAEIDLTVTSAHASVFDRGRVKT